MIELLKEWWLASSILILTVILLKMYFNGGTYNKPRPSLNGKTAVVTGGNGGIGA